MPTGNSTFRTGVRELVEFVHRRGDLGGSGVFRAPDRALEGTRIHRRIQNARGPDYTAEVPVEWRASRGVVETILLGRVDGILEKSTPPIVEEIKTVDRFWSGCPDPLHTAQLKIYGAILAAQRGWPEVELRLTHVQLGAGAEFQTTLRERRETLQEFLEETLEAWFAWIVPEAARLARRDASLEKLKFPFGAYRGGQRDLARRVYSSIRDGHNLFAEAPTGSGKTMAVLFPTLKALPLLGEGRVFFLTAKTPGRTAAEEALAALQSSGAQVRSATLTAKNKICFTENPAGCDLRTCPYAIGYHDRIRGALQDLAAVEDHIGRAQIEETARRHSVCPHELSLDISDWCDVVIVDFNHAFDPSAKLQRHFGGDCPAQNVLLVDEAHNLVDRSRDMHSAEISPADLQIRPGAARAKGSAKARRATAHAAAKLADACAAANTNSDEEFPARSWHENQTALTELPAGLADAFHLAKEALESLLTSLPPGTPMTGWIEPWFALSDWLRAAAAFDASCRAILSPGGRVRIFCADPSDRLRADLKGVRSAVFFSATLSPMDYFRDLLGGGDDDASIELESPFSPDQLSLRTLPLDLTLKARKKTLSAVAEAVAAHIRSRPGNHLVFCPSHSYLAELHTLLAPQLPGIPLAVQSPAMDETARTAFLAHFGSASNTTGLAVLGGVFSEGIDLPGERLVGVCVVGTGLPRLSLERDILRTHFEKTRGTGYDYAYLFPGIQRVLQAAGRLIRSPSDTGSALLIDRRFTESSHRSLLPRWWPAPH
jgi:Rad3-related DNA helicase